MTRLGWRAGVVGLAAVVLLAASAQAAEAKGKKYALVVGVNEYDHSSLNPLKFAENAVEKLAAEQRSRSAGFASVRVLTASRGKKDPRNAPTAANIRAALTQLLAERTRHDTVLIALSGHGAQVEAKTYPYFCPSDADFERISFATGDSRRLVNLNDLFDRLGRCGAGTKLVLLDACRNTLKAKTARRNIDIDKVLIPRGVGALFSCSAGQFAHETDKLGHGVFFHFVLERLRGKGGNRGGEVTWDRLKEYVKEQVTEEAPRLVGGGAKQEPHEMGNLTGKPPVLVGMREAEREYRAGLELYHGHKGRVAWYRKAADKGDSGGQFHLGEMYRDGRGVPKDEKQAAAWFRKAAAQKHKQAEEALKKLGG